MTDPSLQEPSLICPESVVIQLVENGTPLPLPEVAFTILARAKRKNDFHLGPVYTNEDGGVVMTSQRRRMEATVFDCGLMDYTGLNNCYQKVAIRHLSCEECLRLASFRKTRWHILLAGEQDEYASIDEFVRRLERSNNHRLQPSGKPFIATWDGSSANHSYCYSVRRIEFRGD